MGTRTAIPIEEYLHTSFPGVDQEYRDGALVERTLPDFLHGKTQALLCAFFLMLRSRLAVCPCVETRMRLRPDLVLTPDVAVFYPNEPALLPETPPLIVVEVFSVDDRRTQVLRKLKEYRAWGVIHVWLVDPHERRLFSLDDNLIEKNALTVPELDIELLPRNIFDWE